MLLDAAQLLAVTGRKYTVVTYSDEMAWQYMKRQQVEEFINVHGHDSMLASLLVHFVIIRDMSVCNIEYPGISDGHTIGIAPDVFEHLSDSLGRRLGMDDPVLVEAFLANALWNGNSLFFQSAGQEIPLHAHQEHWYGIAPCERKLF